MKSRVLPIILSIFALCMLVIFPDKYSSATLDGILLFAVNVLPSLLPFFFFTKILSGMGVGSYVGKFLDFPCRKLFNTSGIGGYVFVMSILSGYPVGAKLLSDLYTDKQITKSDVNTIMAFTSTSGPMFILGTVGTVMLKNQLYGLIILICHYLSAIINGLIFRNKNRTTKSNYIINSAGLSDSLLVDSVYNSVVNVLICGAYIAIFYMVGTMLIDLGVLGGVANLLNSVINNTELCNGFVFGLIEITGGCKLLSQTSSILTLPLISAVITFGGLSVTLQSLTFLSKCGVRLSQYLIRKVIQTILSFGLTYFAVVIFCL